MRDIVLGIIILIVCFFIIDFAYTEKNTCTISKTGYTEKPVKCGILKKQFSWDINIMGRYW